DSVAIVVGHLAVEGILALLHLVPSYLDVLRHRRGRRRDAQDLHEVRLLRALRDGEATQIPHDFRAFAVEAGIELEHAVAAEWHQILGGSEVKSARSNVHL